MLDLLKLKTFVAVAATGSFTRAALQLGYSQSSVTSHIQALELELDTQLFDRLAKKTLLTQAGRSALDYANRLLALADETEVAVREQSDNAGTLSVSAPDSLLAWRLPKVLSRWRLLHPLVHLDVASGSDSRDQLESVLDGTVDMAFVIAEGVDSDRFSVRCLSREELVVVAVPGHIQSGDQSLTLLKERNFPVRGVVERLPRAEQYVIGCTLELASAEAVKQCAIAGMGLAILPEFVVLAELQSKMLVSLPWSECPAPVFTQMLSCRGRSRSMAFNTLWRLAEEMLGDELNRA